MFSLEIIVSPLNTLLVFGGGHSEVPNLADAITKLQHQILQERDRIDKMRDPVAIDYWLAKQGEFFAIDPIEVIGLSLHNKVVQDIGGGVIGSPFKKIQSSQGQVDFITDDTCIIAFPESPGIALMGIDQLRVRHFMQRIKRVDVAKFNIYELLNLVKVTAAAGAFVIFDGCGRSESGGGFFIKKDNFQKIYCMTNTGTSGQYWVASYNF